MLTTGTSPETIPLYAAGLERRFGSAHVLRGVDLAVQPGRLHLVAGPNGAGKTTLLRILAGLMQPTAGAVQILGASLHGNPALRGRIGLLSHQSLLYDDLTPEENLIFTARLYRLDHPGTRAENALAAVGLKDRMREPVRRLSRGMVQRVAIARALLHQPKVLLLDEPFTGLDAPSVERVLAVLETQLASGCAMVLVSHSLHEAWPLAHQISVLVRGRWVIDEPRPDDREGFLPRFHEALGG